MIEGDGSIEDEGAQNSDADQIEDVNDDVLEEKDAKKIGAYTAISLNHS